jgi:hypothetical protein
MGLGHSGAEYIVLWIVIALALPILIAVGAYSLYMYGIFQKVKYRLVHFHEMYSQSKKVIYNI